MTGDEQKIPKGHAGISTEEMHLQEVQNQY